MSAAVLFALASLFSAQELDGIAAARLETSAGKVPSPGTPVIGADGTATDPPSLSTLAFEATPSASGILTLRSARISLAYSPRLYYRYPLEASDGDTKPLALHRLTLTYAHSLARDLGFDLSVSASKGDIDYVRATTGNTIDPNLPVPPASVINVTSVNGAAAVSKTFGSSETLEFSIRPSYTQPQTSTVVATTQIRTSADVTYTRSFTSRDLAEFAIGGDAISFSEQNSTVTSTVYTVRASGLWSHTFNRSFSAHLLVGASTALGNVRVLPLGETGFAWDIYRRGNLHFATGLTVGVDTFSNPLTGSFDGRFISSFTFTLEIGSRLAILATGSYFTIITTPSMDAQPVMGVGVSTNESVFQARLPISYEITNDLSVELGVRTSLRGPRVQNFVFDLSQPELVGYLSITGSIDTRVPAFSR